MMDKTPFTELHGVVSGMRDPRIRVFAEQIGPQYNAKKADGNWNGEYHDLLYSLTDSAIMGEGGMEGLEGGWRV